MWLRDGAPALSPSTLCVFFNPVQGEHGNVALMEACQYGQIERATVLLEHGADVNCQDEVKITSQ